MGSKKISQLTAITNPHLSGVTIYDDGVTSYKTSLDTLRQTLVDSGSHHITGSQFIDGDTYITGTLFISGSHYNHLVINHRMKLYSDSPSHYPGIEISGSDTSTVTIWQNGIDFEGHSGLGGSLNANDGYCNLFDYRVSNTEFGLALHSEDFNDNWAGPSIYSNDNTDSYPSIIGFQNSENWTDGRVTFITNTESREYVILPKVANELNFTDDVAAANGGVPIGGLYHTSGTIKIRLS